MAISYHPKKTPASNAMTDLIRAALRLSAHADKVGGKLVADLGLTSARWQTLGQLRAAPRPFTVSELARHMGLARQSVQRLVDEMAAEGLVHFVANPRNRRAPHLALTLQGRRVYARSLDREWRWTNLLARPFPARELAAAAMLLNSVNNRMLEHPPVPSPRPSR